jgi:hypothetical protein
MRMRLVRSRMVAAAAMVTLIVGAAGVPVLSEEAPASGAPASSVVPAPTFSPPLTIVGQVNLSALAKSQAASQMATSPQGAALSGSTSGAHRSVDNSIAAHAPKGPATNVPTPATTPITGTNVKGETGFSAMGGVQQASTKGGSDLEPPDQGLCAGGGYVMEFLNNAVAIYSPTGAQLMAPVGSASAFLQPTTAFFSDPRCYYDAPTKRWFYQEFIVGTLNAKGQVVTPSTQFIAVSNTADPTGSYTVFSFDTTDTSTAGCPCFGDYDQLGADNNGIYIATDEFGITSPAFNGTIVYAISKETLEIAAQVGFLPTVFAYRLAKDPFGQPYIVAPTSTPPGAKFAPNTEYFVESNSDASSDNKLLVYALNDTSTLASPAPPTLYRTMVTTVGYSFPNDAAQKPGPRPLGTSVQDAAGGIQADFNAEMEPTYVGGQIYAQLDTATASGSDAVDWFIIDPTLSGSTLSATVAHEGTLAVKGTSLLYPYTAVSSAGVGYLLFSLSGPNNYPSPGYIAYNVHGPTGSVIVATPGAAPEDGFTCYAAYVGPSYGGCRWGDYSQGVVMNQRVIMATEMIPSGFRDTLTNWGTYIWSAAPPVPAG